MTEFEQTKQLAELGNADAQYKLGVMYYHGDGVEKDLNESIKWFKKAAEQGDVVAKHWLNTLPVPTQPKRDFTGESRLERLNNLQKEIRDAVLSYDGAITLAEAIGVLEIAKIELYNNQTVSNKR